MRLALPLLLLVACTSNDQKVGVYNVAPSVNITAPTDGESFDEGTVIEFEAVVSDDGDNPGLLLLIWASDLDNELSSGQSASTDGVAAYPTANLSPGNHTISLRVIDSQGESDMDTIQVGVIDLPDAPEVSIVHPAATESGIEEEEFEFIIEVSDAQDDPEDIDLAFESSLDGVFCTPTSDIQGTATCLAALSPGDHVLTFRAEDTQGFTSAATATFVVVPRTEIDDDGDQFSEIQGDCDDTDPNTYPGANEYEDGQDNDCDGDVDEETGAFDDDGDCYCETAPCMGSVHSSCTSIDGGDCNDANPAISPAATEICDGTDNDCDTSTDESDAADATTWYADADNDGYGSATNSTPSCSQPTGYVSDTSDCYDNNASANPAQAGYFTAPRGDSSYDYSCDQVEEKHWTTTASSCSFLSNGSCSATGGWSSVPSCGSSGTWNDNCHYSTDGNILDWGCYFDTSSKTQECR